jgi:hypothetical protein
MQNITSVIKKINSLLPLGIEYPSKLLSKFNLTIPLDKEYFKYLTQGGEAGGYLHWLTLLTKHSDAKLIVESGNRYGNSTIAIYHGLKKNQKLISVDIVKDQRYIPNIIYKDKRVKFIFGDCLDLNSYDKDTLIPIDIDIFWTDTIHTYEQISSEFFVYEPLLSDEAIIVIDDINLNDKGKFFHESPYPKFDLTNICHSSGFGVIHYIRPKSERNKSHSERINKALLNSIKIWHERYENTNLKYNNLKTYTNPPLLNLLKRILKNPRKHRNIPQKYIKDGTERGVNQNPLKKIKHKIKRW